MPITYDYDMIVRDRRARAAAPGLIKVPRAYWRQSCGVATNRDKEFARQ